MTNNKTEGVWQKRDFLQILQDNWQAQIAGFFNDDKTDEEKRKRNAVIEEYQDLIAIYKSNLVSPPSPPAGVEERAKEYANVCQSEDFDSYSGESVFNKSDIIKAFIAGSESQGREAVEFAEWVRNEGWEPAPKEFKSWYRKLVASKLEKKTTEQLYSMFRLTPPPASPE